ARRDVEGHAIDRDQHASPRRKLDAEVTDGEDRGGHYLSFGLRASRSQSPRRLTASTSAASATPGNSTIQYSPDIRKLLPMRISVPSEGSVGGRPTPRKDRVASVRMASARLMVAMTSTGLMTLGSTCRNMMLKGPRPISRAACTYSLLRSTRVTLRTVR